MQRNKTLSSILVPRTSTSTFQLCSWSAVSAVTKGASDVGWCVVEMLLMVSPLSEKIPVPLAIAMDKSSATPFRSTTVMSSWDCPERVMARWKKDLESWMLWTSEISSEETLGMDVRNWSVWGCGLVSAPSKGGGDGGGGLLYGLMGEFKQTQLTSHCLTSPEPS